MANSQHIPGLIRGHKGTIIMVDHGKFESPTDHITLLPETKVIGKDEFRLIVTLAEKGFDSRQYFQREDTAHATAIQGEESIHVTYFALVPTPPSLKCLGEELLTEQLRFSPPG